MFAVRCRFFSWCPVLLPPISPVPRILPHEALPRQRNHRLSWRRDSMSFCCPWVSTELTPLTYEKSQKTEGLISRYTYVAPTGRSPAELFRNYKLEFQRAGSCALYEKEAGAKGSFREHGRSNFQ